MFFKIPSSYAWRIVNKFTQESSIRENQGHKYRTNVEDHCLQSTIRVYNLNFAESQNLANLSIQFSRRP